MQVDILRALQWWDEWQLRILVLGSLGLQWFLLLAAPMRNYAIPRLFRFSIWVAYLSADALAIYALATLFNRHSKATTSSSSCDYETNKGSYLEVLWAPLLLVYLGGREEITAYTIEDNELWTRQTVTLVSQVTVAVYSFYKSWSDSNDRKLLLSAILLFVIGIISFIEKPWALRRASIKRLVAIWSVMEGRKRESPGGGGVWDWCFTELSDRYKCWTKLPEDDAPILSQSDQVQMILSDLSLYAAEVTLQARSKGNLKILEPLDVDKDVRLRRMLRQAFGLIYTRANVIFTPAYLACHVMLVPSLYIAAVTLFAASRSKRGRYGATDVKITYILLCFTAVLDVFGLLISELMYKLMTRTKLAALCERIPGLSLVDSVLRTVRRPVTGSLLNFARRLGYYYKKAEAGGTHHQTTNLYRPVSDAIALQLVKAFRVKNVDLSSFRSFTKTDYWTTEQTMRLLNLKTTYKLTAAPEGFNKAIWRSLRKTPFDRSVLIWHIATNLCFRKRPPMNFRCRPPHGEVLREVCTEAISNYMAYLMTFRPDMLMTGTTQDLFAEATRHMEDIVRKSQGSTEKERKDPDFDRNLLDKIRNEAGRLRDDKAYTVIDDACTVADELLRMKDDDDRWHLMHRMWVGMLCYSASMCRGYLHAKSLGEGGEFLSYVWLLISLQGAKTLADTLQMPNKEHGDDELEDDQKREHKESLDKNVATTKPAGWDPKGRMFRRQPAN